LEATVKLEDAQTPEDLDRFLDQFVQRSIRKTWLRGYSSGVIAGKAIALGEPMPPSILQYLMATLDDSLDESLEDEEP
jgi:hypothetical protein